MKVFSIDGITPVIDSTAYVHPSAVLIGDVIIGAGCYIGPCASLRGDYGRIVVRDGANLQDTCVMHGFPNADTVVEKNGHISHGAVIHGARIGENAMIGINAVVMDEAEIGKECMVAAMSYVKPGFRAPPRSVIAGIPAVVKRDLKDDEVTWKTEGTELYQQLAVRSQQTMQEVAPLTEVEPDRRRMTVGNFSPLHKRDRRSL